MKYKIWNKKDPIITPSGAVFTAEQWIARYPIAQVEGIDVLCADSEINGAFFGTLGSMVEQYESRGADFSDCVTGDEKLARMAEFDAEQEAEQKAAAEAEANKLSDQTRIADALEDIVALNLPDVK